MVFTLILIQKKYPNYGDGKITGYHGAVGQGISMPFIVRPATDNNRGNVKHENEND